MAHLRTQIRDYVRNLVQANLPMLAAPVDPSPVYDEGPLPAARVRTPTETAAPNQINRLFARELDVVIDLYTAATGDVQKELDDMSVFIEQAMDGDFRLGGLATDSIPSEMLMELSDGLERPVGRLSLTYTVTYQSRVGDPETPV